MENFNFNGAKVRRDGRYALRFVITDRDGYWLMKKQSHKATQASPRFWTSFEKAQKALELLSKKQEKKNV